MNRLLPIISIVLLLPLLFASPLTAQTDPKAELVVQTGHSDAVVTVVFSRDGKQIVSGSWDTKTKIWDSETGKELASLIALDEGDWAVTTPDGLFDASPAARKLMHYVIGLESVSLDQMKDGYYIHGLLQKI